MSQVIRKFQNGGIVKPDLYTRREDKWDKKQLLKSARSNVQVYLDNNNINGEMADMFKKSLNTALTGIQNGTFIYNDDNTFTDKTNTLSSNGNRDSNLFGTRNTENNANGFVANYLNSVMDHVGQYIPPKKEAFNLQNQIETNMKNRFHSEDAYKTWMKSASVLDRATEFKKALKEVTPQVGDWFDKYDMSGANWKDTNTLSTALNSLANVHSVSKGKLDPKFNDLALKAGLDLTNLYADNTAPKKPLKSNDSDDLDSSSNSDSGNTTPPADDTTTAPQAYIYPDAFKNFNHLNAANRAAAAKMSSSVLSSTPWVIANLGNKYTDKMGMNYIRDNGNVYGDKNIQNSLSAPYLDNNLRNINNLDVRNNILTAIAHGGKNLVKMPSGTLLLPSIDFNNGTAYVFHNWGSGPAQGTFEKVNIYKNENIYQFLRREYAKYYKPAVKKAANGLKIDEAMRRMRTNLSGPHNAAQTQAERNMQAYQANKLQSTKYQDNSRTVKSIYSDPSDSENIRTLGTTVMAGTGLASMIPGVGAAAGAVGGLIGLGADLYADLKEGKSSSEIWKNIGANAALTGLGLITNGAGNLLRGAATGSKALKLGATAAKVAEGASKTEKAAQAIKGAVSASKIAAMKHAGNVIGGMKYWLPAGMVYNGVSNGGIQNTYKTFAGQDMSVAERQSANELLGGLGGFGMGKSTKRLSSSIAADMAAGKGNKFGITSLEHAKNILNTEGLSKQQMAAAKNSIKDFSSSEYKAFLRGYNGKYGLNRPVTNNNNNVFSQDFLNKTKSKEGSVKNVVDNETKPKAVEEEPIIVTNEESINVANKKPAKVNPDDLVMERYVYDITNPKKPEVVYSDSDGNYYTKNTFGQYIRTQNTQHTDTKIIPPSDRTIIFSKPTILEGAKFKHIDDPVYQSKNGKYYYKDPLGYYKEFKEHQIENLPPKDAAVHNEPISSKGKQSFKRNQQRSYITNKIRNQVKGTKYFNAINKGFKANIHNPNKQRKIRRLVDKYNKIEYKQGGVLQYGAGGGFLTSAQAITPGVSINNLDSITPAISGIKPISNWYNNIFLGYQNDLGDYLKKNANNYQNVNTMQRSAAKLYDKYGKNLATSKYAQRGIDVGDYQQKIKDNFSWVNNKGLAKNKFNTSGIRNSGDSLASNWKVDNAYGGETEARRLLGRKSDFEGVTGQQNFSKIQQWLNGLGYNAVLNNNTNYYELTPLTDKVIPSQQALNANHGTTVVGSTPAKSVLGRMQVNPADLLSLSRAVYGNYVNDTATDKYLKSLTPVIKNTYQLESPVYGNYLALANVNNQAGRVQSAARTPVTSNASLGTAAQLEAATKAGDLLIKGQAADADTFYKTLNTNNAVNQDNQKRFSDTANENLSSMRAMDAAKASTLYRKNLANFNQIWSPYMAQVESQYRENKALDKQLKLQQYQNQYTDLWNQFIASTDAKYKKGEITEEQRTKMYNDERAKQTAAMLKIQEALYSNPYMFGLKPEKTKINYNKNGGKVSDFNKSQIAYAKMSNTAINRMVEKYMNLDTKASKSIINLIYKGMNLKK